MDFNLTKEEFDKIGQQAFINWFDSVKHKLWLPEFIITSYNLDSVEVLYKNCDVIVGVIVFSVQKNNPYQPNYINKLNIMQVTQTFGKVGVWCVDYDCTYKNITYGLNSTMSKHFNKFIELEKLKILAKPYGMENEVEELFM